MDLFKTFGAPFFDLSAVISKLYKSPVDRKHAVDGPEARSGRTGSTQWTDRKHARLDWKYAEGRGGHRVDWKYAVEGCRARTSTESTWSALSFVDQKYAMK